MKKLLPFILYVTGAVSLTASGEVTKKPELIDIGLDIEWLPITNSMVTSWAVSLFIIALIRITVGKPKLIPGKGQIVIESIIGTVRTIIQPIVGKKVFFPSFWLN